MVLHVMMVKYILDIFVDKRSAIVSNKIVRDAKFADYVLSDEICNSWACSLLSGMASTHFVKYLVAISIQI